MNRVTGNVNLVSRFFRQSGPATQLAFVDRQPILTVSRKVDVAELHRRQHTGRYGAFQLRAATAIVHTRDNRPNHLTMDPMPFQDVGKRNSVMGVLDVDFAALPILQKLGRQRLKYRPIDKGPPDVSQEKDVERPFAVYVPEVVPNRADRGASRIAFRFPFALLRSARRVYRGESPAARHGRRKHPAMPGELQPFRGYVVFVLKPVAVDQRSFPGPPVSVQQSLAFNLWSSSQFATVAGVRCQQDFVVFQIRGDKRERKNIVFGQLRMPFNQLGFAVSPFVAVIRGNEVTDNAIAFGDRESGIRINPPGNEIGDPTGSVRIAGTANVGLYTAGRSVSSEQVKELAAREVRQFVESDVAILRSHVIVFVFFVLQVAATDHCARVEDGVKRLPFPQPRAKRRKPFPHFIPDATAPAKLGHRAAKNDSREFGVPVVANRFGDKLPSLATASSPAKYQDVGRTEKRFFLRARLRANFNA